MFEFKFCRICLDDNVPMHPILGSQVQDVYEKITNKKVQDGPVHLACYICHRQLQNCQEVLIKAQTSDELLKQFLSINSELDEYPVSFVTRMTYGLVHSLSTSNIQSFQIPEHNKIIKTESHSESDNEEAMAEDGPHYDGTITKEEHELYEDHNICNNDISESVENEQNKNISDPQSNTSSNENTSHQMLCDETSNQLVNDIKMFICNDCGKTCDTKARLIKHICGHEPANIKPEAMFQEALAREGEAKGTLANQKLTRNKKHNSEQDKAKCIEGGKSENISETETSVVPAKDKLSERVCHGKSKLVLVNNNNKKYFICNECGKIYDSKALLIKHIVGHKPAITDQSDTCKTNQRSLYYRKCTKSDNACKSSFLCQYCNYICDSDSNLRKHMNKTHKCKYCGYTCAVNSLKVHIKTHAGEKPYKCQHCNYTCAASTAFKRHTRTHTGEKPFKCQYCSYASGRNSTLKQHIIIRHTGEMPFKCQYCSYTCAASGALKRHTRTHTGEKPYKCHYCSYTCANNGPLKEHIRKHTGEKPYKCQYCSYSCGRSGQLKQHAVTHTREKPFKCQYCNFACGRNGTLKHHIILRHTDEKPFKCQYCSYSCACSSKLKLHSRIHTGEKPFNCQYCSYTCALSGDLKRHVRIHTGEKPYKCQYCSLTFSRNFHLQNHTRRHTGEKPFKCQYCSYTFVESSELKKHTRTHTGEKPYACEICDKRFAIKNTLKEHLQVHMDKKYR